MVTYKLPAILLVALFAADSTLAQGGDECATAHDAMSMLSIPYDNSGATTSNSDTCTNLYFGVEGGYFKDVWFTWTAPTTDQYRATNVAGISVHVLAIYDGCGVPIACDWLPGHYSPGPGVEGAWFSAIAGNSYQLRIGGWAAFEPPGSGTIELLAIVDGDGDGYYNWQECDDSDPGIYPGATEVCGNGIDEDCDGVDTSCTPANDDICAAELISGDGSFPFDSTGAVTESVFCSASGGLIDDDVWYEWSAPVTGYATVRVTSQDEAVIGVFDGADCANSALTACDWNPFMGEVLTFPVTASNSYLITIGGWAGAVDGTLDFTTIEATNFCDRSPNSFSALGSTLTASGSASIAANDLVLHVSECPNEPGVFFYGPGMLASGFPFGEGTRCVPGTIVRINPPIQIADHVGASTDAGPGAIPAENRLDNTASQIAGSPFPFVAGSTLNFQFWHRDAGDQDGDGTAEGFNLTDGLSITFSP